MTPASWMRSFIRNHPKYNFDSEVSEEIAYDLSVRMDKISKGEVGCPELFARPETKTSELVPDKCHEMEQEYEMFVKKVTERQKMMEQTSTNAVPSGHGSYHGDDVANGDFDAYSNGVANGNGIANGNGVANENGIANGNGVAYEIGIVNGNGIANGNGVANGDVIAHGNERPCCDCIAGNGER